MTPLPAIAYSFLFGLLHGALPDEHTWPITFSYALGGASGRQGMRAGLYFSAAFTVQRALLSEVAHLALAPFLLAPGIDGIVYVVVGMVMTAAGALVVGRGRYAHLHLVGHHHRPEHRAEQDRGLLSSRHRAQPAPARAMPARWAVVHGFVAGFGIGGFSLFVNTVAAPAMPSAWLGFVPGLAFGLGTMLVLALIGAFVGNALRWTHALTPDQIQRIGTQTGGRALFFGGLLFTAFGAATLLGLDRVLPVNIGYALITLFMVGIVTPALVYSWREVKSADRAEAPPSADHPGGARAVPGAPRHAATRPEGEPEQP